MSLTIEEILNGIDLANQSPRAALEREGYIDWLAKAHAQGMRGADAILWARVHSFIEPTTQQWNAPGLGNSQDRITRDQQRRMWAIWDTIATVQQPVVSSIPKQRNAEEMSDPSSAYPGIDRLFTQPSSTLFTPAAADVSHTSDPESPIVQQILDLDLSVSL